MGCCKSSDDGSREDRSGSTEAVPMEFEIQTKETILDKPHLSFTKHSAAGKTFEDDFERNYRFQKTISKTSSFSRVMEAKRKSPDSIVGFEMVAVKILSKDTHPRASAHLYNSELSVLSELQRTQETVDQSSAANLVRLIDNGEDKNHYYIVTELLSGGRLIEEVVKYAHSGHPMSEALASKWVASMLRSVAYIHAVGVVHRDLSSEHFVFSTPDLDDAQCRLVLVGFGAATVLDSNPLAKYKSLRGTLHYLSPESAVVALSRSEKPRVADEFKPLVPDITADVLKAADVWAIGVIAYILVIGKAPFVNTKDEALLRSITKGFIDFDMVEVQTSGSFRDFIRKALAIHSTDRWSAEELLEHEWISRDTAEERRQFVMSDLGVSALSQLSVQSRLKQAVTEVMLANMNQTTEAQLKEQFRRLDHDGDGYLEEDELIFLLEDLGYARVDATKIARKVVTASDENDDCAIDFNEFIRYKYRTALSGSEAYVQKIFDVFDVDGNGVITLDELEMVLGEAVHKVGDERLKDERPGKMKIKSIVAEVTEDESTTGVTLEVFRQAMFEEVAVGGDRFLEDLLVGTVAMDTRLETDFLEFDDEPLDEE